MTDESPRSVPMFCLHTEHYPEWHEEREHLVIESDRGKPFVSGCDCEIGRDHYEGEDSEAMRHLHKVVPLLVAQFRSDVEYTGAEVIGRLREMEHLLEPEHPGEGEPCPICDDDPSV